MSAVYAFAPQPAARFDVNSYAVEDMQLLNPEDFSRIVAPYVGKQKTVVDLHNAQRASSEPAAVPAALKFDIDRYVVEGYTLLNPALTLNGAAGSGLFQDVLSAGTNIRLDGSAPPVQIFGGSLYARY